MEKRKSSQTRINTGTALSVYFSSTFAWSTALQHNFSVKDAIFHISKYFSASLLVSFIYFSLNEQIYFELQKRSIKNYFLSHSLTSLLTIPLFTISQKARGFSWKDSRIFSYRYIGTLCCCSLMSELIISIYRNSFLDNFNEVKLDIFNRAQKREDLIKQFEASSGKKIPSD